jgi:hypothetical protein
MTIQETPMPYVSCPTTVIIALVDVVWVLMQPAAWGGVFNVRVGSIGPPGPAIVGRRSAARPALESFI